MHQILSPTKKGVICSHNSPFLFQMGYLKSTKVLEHVRIKLKHLSLTKSAEINIF